MEDLMDFAVLKELYRSASIATMPLPFGKKEKPKIGWTELSVEDLWADVPDRSNVAIIAGRNNIIILDADDQPSSQGLSSYMSSLGINHVGSKTQRGEHWWLRVNGIEEIKQNTSKLPTPLNGDVRIRNSYALAAPSYYGDYAYQQIGSVWEIPRIDINDLRPLLPRQVFEYREKSDGFPVQTIRRPDPAWVIDLAGLLNSLEKGKPVTLGNHTWGSRSEAVFSAILSMKLRGATDDEVIQQFGPYYKDDVWFTQAISRAVIEICNLENRQLLAALYHHPQPIPGDTGALDYSVYMAFISLAWLLNRMNLYSPVRDIAMLAGVSKNTAGKSLRRLVDLGLLGIDNSTFRSTGSDSYILNESVINYINIYRYRYVSYVSLPRHYQELWRRDALGKEGQQVYGALDNEPKSVSMLQDLTGRSRTSVTATLTRLQGEGLAERSGRHSWARGNADIKYLLKKYNAEEVAKRRAAVFEDDRKQYRAKIHRVKYFSLSTSYNGLAIDDELLQIQEVIEP